VSRDGALVDCGVVGGGPSGLMLALLLARRGWRVTVVERGEGSDARLANISPFLSPPSLRLLEDLGLLGELVQIGQSVREVVESLVGGGRYVLDYAERVGGGFGYALSVPLLTLTGVLRDALAREASATVLTETAVRGVVDSGGGVALELADREGVRSIACRFVVCSDGKFSKVRGMAGINAEVFEFDRPLVMMLVPSPPGWPERMAIHHAERESLVAVMPVAEGKLAVQWLAGPEEFEKVRVAGVNELRSRVTRVLPELADLLAATVIEWDQVLIVWHHVVRPEVWFRGRVGLLGDSAHGVHSLGGQGLNMGIQDAIVLGSSLVEAGVDADDTPFAVYERLRRPFVERFQRYQMRVPQLTSQASEGTGQGAIYGAIADVMTCGQPEAGACYQRLIIQ
jgi:2-polyprenyl-6-methoxyphenol hydroxylase-like FAD-dependent oxidoreductase